MNYRNIVLAATSLLLLTTSCSDWLDVQPKTELKEKELFATEQGFQEALTGAYVSMTYPATYGRELTFGMLSVMASDYSVNSSSPQAVLSLKAIEEYDYSKNQVKSLIDQIWLNQYHSIALVNNLLRNIDLNPTILSKEGYKQIKGEALALRAFLHFDLMRLFAPSFAMKDQEKYMPYVTLYSRENTSLSTLDELADLLIRDIEAAETLLEHDMLGGTGVVDRKIKINKLAVKGLKARLFLYMNNKAGAYELAKGVIDAKQISLRPENQDINLDRSIHEEHLFSLYAESFEERVTNAVTPEAGLQASVPYYFTDEFKIRTGIFEDQSTDVRYKAPSFQVYKGILTPHKFVYVDLPPGTRNAKRFYIPLIKLSEMYLIAAESAPTAAEGLSYLNTLCTNKGLLQFGATVDLQEEIQQEYRKDFFTEGQLFYYYKRLATRQVKDSPVTDMSNTEYVFPMPENEKIYGGRN